MASVTKAITIDADPSDVWEALRDYSAVHERLVPGFVTGTVMEEDDVRVVTFFNGAVAREKLVSVDDVRRRLVYSVIEGPLGSAHHNASAQVFADGERGSRFVWITDVLPDEVADPTDAL